MNTPLKGNEDIRSNGDAFIDAYLRARDELGRLEGVVAVGFGRKEVADKLTADISITVFVLEKVPDSELAPGQKVPPEFEGYRTDVRVVPDITPAKCDNEDPYDPIEGGIQIQARDKESSFSGDDGKGTLGCIVRKRGNDSGENFYLLTANHALDTDNAGLGGVVYHPYAPPANDTTGSKIIAFIEERGTQDTVEYTGRRPSNGEELPMDGYIDCGIARLDLASECCGIKCSADNVRFNTTIIDLDPGDATNNRIADVRDISLDFDMTIPLDQLGTATDANRVVKVGRTTGRTVGIVTLINSAARHGGDIVAGLIEIELDPALTPGGVNCKGNPRFIEGGDSGALVLDMDNKAVGLAFATKTRPDGRISCFACHIVPVLDTLNICIPTTGGTSHGSSLATDGSGIARYGGSLESDSDTVLFTSQTVAGRLDTAAQSRAAAMSTSSLVQIEEFVDRLRHTEQGRRLHDAYAHSISEIGFLIRTRRQVMVTWHRNKGPAFLAGIADHLRGNAASMPIEIDGVSREMMLANMERVLLAHASKSLRVDLERHRDAVFLCSEAATAEECLRLLERAETQIVA